MKRKYHILISSLALVCLFSLAKANKTKALSGVIWGERLLTWDDFPLIKSIDGGDFDARIYSEIQFEGQRADNSLRIYARMLPYRSGRVDLEGNEQLLIHEQKHFDITEYHARLFRKEVIDIGQEKLTKEELQSLGKKYVTQNRKMQARYDFESEHNTMRLKQRYWELYIEGLLRETAYYAEENIYNYQEFSGGKTDWFRQVYLTLNGELLTSYPENNKNKQYGEVYQVKRKNDSIIVSFFNNGIQKAGGYFKAPVSLIIFPNTTSRETHLFDKEGNYFISKNTVPITRSISDLEGNITRTFYDGKGKQISKEGIYSEKGKWNEKQKSYYYSYYDKNDKQISYEGVFHELREMDDRELTWRISNFDKAGKPMRDKDFVSIYEFEFNEKNEISRIKRLDIDGKHAVYKYNHNTVYDFDSRGNIASESYFNERGNKWTDDKGIHRYTYTYDVYNNLTDIRKFNLRDLAANGNDEFHQNVNLFDSLGRMTFTAQYYPNYVLKFDEDKEGARLYEAVGDSILIIRNFDAYREEINNEMGTSKAKQFLDSKQNVVREDYFNADGYWAKTENGVTSFKYKYDERGNLIEQAAFDSLGNLRAWKEDVSITRWEFDARKNKIKTTYFTINNELANAVENITFNFYKYDENDNFLERTNYDRNMNPGLIDGAYRTSFDVNRFGKDSIVKVYGVNDKIIKGPNIIKYLYNDRGVMEAEIFYDENFNPALNEKGIHKRIYNHDKYDRYIGYSYKGKNDEAINDHQGISNMMFHLSASGFVQRLSYFDKSQNPVYGPNAYHMLENHFNDMDELVRFTRYDTGSNPSNNDDGIADFVFGQNDIGRIGRISYYDEDRNLVEDSDGIAEYYYTPSLNGLFYLEKQLDAQGKEVVDSDIEMD